MISKVASRRIGTHVSLQTKRTMAASSAINKIITDLLEQSAKVDSDLRVSQFAKNLDYLREKHESRSNKINGYINRMRAASINSQIPLKDILRQFIASTRLGFDQRMTTEALFFISATLKSFGINPNHYYDYNLEHLKNSWRFEDLVGDFRYGLKSGVEFSPDRIASSLRALKALEYTDTKIVREAILKIGRMLEDKDDDFSIDYQNIVENNPSIHKPLYYMRYTLNPREIVENKEFQQFLRATIIKQEEELSEKLRKEEENKVDAQTILLKSQLTTEEQILFDEVEVISKKISKSVQKSSVAIKKTIESVIQIRKHYLRMIESQEKVQSVNLTPQLNLDLLNLEESMIEVGIISLSEVKNPQLIVDTNKNREAIASIVQSLIAQQNEGFLSYFDSLVQAQPELADIHKKREQFNPVTNFQPVFSQAQYADALLAVTEFANQKGLERQGKTYLNEKWADYFKDVEDADRLFFVSFLDSQKYFQEIAPIVLKSATETDPSSLGIYAGAFANIGLIGVSKQLISKIRSIEGISSKAAIQALRVCSEFPQEFSDLSKKLLGNLALNPPTFPSEAVDLVYYQIALDQLNLESVSHLKEHLKFIQVENSHLHFVSQFLKLQGIDLGYNSAGSSLYELSVFKQNPIKEKLVELIGKQENLSHIGLGDLKPDFMSLDKNEKGEVTQKAIFITPAEYSYFDIPKSGIEYTLLAKYLYHKNKNITFHFLPITKYLDINHSTHQITIKKDNAIFTELIDLAFKNLYVKLNSDLVLIGEKLLNPDFSLIKSKIKQVFRLSSGRRYLQLSISDLMQVKYLLYSMSLDFKEVLPLERQAELNQVTQTLFKTDFISLLKQHSTTELSAPSNSTEEIEFFSKQKWIGKRLSIDLLASKDTKYGSADAFFDYSSVGSENYYEYPEWQTLITESYGVSNVCQLTPTNFLSLQVSDACNNTNSTFIIPHKKDVRSQIRPLDLNLVSSNKDKANYSLNWEKDYYLQGTNDPTIYAGEQYKIEESTKYIANLLNFKWELKKSFTSSQRLQLLQQLSFTDQLISHHLETSSIAVPEDAQFAPRSPEKYQDYLEQKTPSSLYCQEFLDFFMRKADQKNKILALSKLNFEKIKDLYKSYQKSYLSRQQFDQQKAAIQNDLLKVLRQYDAANTSLDVLLQNESTMNILQKQTFNNLFLANRFIDVQFDVESLMKDKTYVKYNLQNDKDYFSSGKDLKKWLSAKRARAEEKLIKAKILSKIDADISLNQLETTYLQKWSKDELVRPTQPTFLTYKDLPAQDASLLKGKFGFSDLVGFEKMQVNDLVFEFASLFEQALINNADIHLKGKTVLKDWGIAPGLISKSATSSLSNYLITLSETQAWREGQQLNTFEIDSARKMLKILQEQSIADKKFTKSEDVLRKEALEVFNLSQNRFEIFLKWLESREQESYLQSVDCTETVMKLWESIFSKSYQTTTSEELHLFIHNLIQRLFVLSKYPPAAFGSFLTKLLLHPQLQIIDKNLLICGLDAFKFNSYLSSKELIDFSRNVRAAHPPRDLAALTKASSFTTDNLLQKISKLIK